MTVRRVSIRYRRLPETIQTFDQAILEEMPTHVVTFLAAADVGRPVTAGGATILEQGSPVIWFTFPGLWYDIGAFHLADGSFTGHYANVLTPVVMEGDRWETTDLCLDVWSGADGTVRILDEADFREAVDHGWMDAEVAGRARETAETLAAAARRGEWPPAIVRGWTLERARAMLAALRPE